MSLWIIMRWKVIISEFDGPTKNFDDSIVHADDIVKR
jgi:hypothetical protein